MMRSRKANPTAMFSWKDDVWHISSRRRRDAAVEGGRLLGGGVEVCCWDLRMKLSCSISAVKPLFFCSKSSLVWNLERITERRETFAV